jgi:hypothetical protein
VAFLRVHCAVRNAQESAYCLLMSRQVQSNSLVQQLRPKSAVTLATPLPTSGQLLVPVGGVARAGSVGRTAGWNVGAKIPVLAT